MGVRSKYAVHFLIEDGFVVRGTLDRHEALAMAVGDDDNFELRYWAAEMARRDDSDDDPTPEQVRALANLCHELISNARPGLYRWSIAQPRDDARVWLMPADERGPGVWQGVEFP
jgi:hypothetical protein